MDDGWVLWEVFVRTRNAMAHRHAGSILATDAETALQNARDVYARLGEETSIWVVPSNALTVSSPSDRDMLFEPAADKLYRHANFFADPMLAAHPEPAPVKEGQ